MTCINAASRMPPTPIATRYSTSVNAARRFRLINVTVHSILRNVAAHFERLRDVLIRPTQADQHFAHVVVVGSPEFDFGDVDCAEVSNTAVGVAAGHAREKWGREGSW